MNKNKQFVISINRELGSGGRTVGEKLAQKLGVSFYDKALIKALILNGMAADESCIIAGRSGFYIFRNHPNHLSILIQASMEQRVQRLVRKRDITPQQAEAIIKEVDTMRDNYITKYTGTNRYDARYYDLVINMDGKTEDQIVELILQYIG